MIKIEELRIGNKVQDNNGFIFYVVSIFEDGTIYCDFEWNEGDVWEFNDNNPCQGIPLTEEILLKCGFVEGLTKPKHYHTKDMMICNIQGMFINVRTDVRIKYLHQLQNLYFCLVGKELNVEL